MIPTERSITTAAEKVAKLVAAIEAARTAYIPTYTRCYKITPATLASWKRSGLVLFKASGDSMMMAIGKKFVCIDYASITTV